MPAVSVLTKQELEYGGRWASQHEVVTWKGGCEWDDIGPYE